MHIWRRRGVGWHIVAPLVILAAISLCGACSSSSTPASGSGPTNTVGKTLSSEKPSGRPTAGGSLVYGIASDSNSLNPTIGQWSGSSYIVANAIYEPLAALDTKGNARPYLAASFTPSPDFERWTIGVRPGITFQDGEKLDALAVATNINLARKSPLLGAAFAPISAVSEPTTTSVLITMSSPWSSFPQILTSQAGYMAAPAMLTAADPTTANPVGTGPFKFQSHLTNSAITVVKNPTYWQAGKPLLDKITFRVLPDDTTRDQTMQAGDIGAMEITTATVLGAYLTKSKAGEVQLLTNAGLETNEFVLALNTGAEPFNDVVARQALGYAIDQNALSKVVYGGVYPGAWGNFEEGSPYYIPRQRAGYPSPNPVRARQLAAQYQQTHGKPLSFAIVLGPDAESARLGQFIQQELHGVGVSVQVEQTDTVSSITRILEGDYQAGYFAMFSAPTLDKGYFFIATKPAATGISHNYTRLDDPVITAAMNAARSTTDTAAQIKDFGVVQKQMAKNLDRIYLYHARLAVAFANDVHGFSAATFPGTSDRAFAPDITQTFLTNVWISR